MQIFELHFNPKLKEDHLFDSFAYEPENIYEKKLGSLYIVGGLQNALPQNSKFLDNLVGVIKNKYYTLSSGSPGEALSKTLKKTNEFLAEEVKRENVSWLGNLNCAIFSLKDFNLNFTKTGDLKILLIRKGEIIDIGKNLDLQEIEPYPLKIFFNIVSGKLSQNDKILALTKEVFEFFQQQNLLNKIAEADSLDEKKLKEILPRQLFTKGDGLKISGICFLAILEEGAETEKEPKKIRFQKEEKFSFFRALSPLTFPFRKIKQIKLPRPKNPLKLLGRALKTKKPSPKIPLPKKPKIELPKSQVLEKVVFKKGTLKNLIKISFPKKNLVLIFALLLFLFLGFLIFKGREIKKEGEVKESLSEIEEKISQAESFLIFKEEERANSLLKEAWLEISALSEKDSSRPEALSLKQTIKEKLENLNKLEKIESPEVLFEFKPEEINFNPKKILFTNSNIYFSNPFSPNLYKFNLKENKGEVLEVEKDLGLATDFSNSILFFVPPDILLFLKNGGWQEKTIQLPDFDFNFDLLSSYISNLYFLDGEKCQIIKYLYLGSLEWGSPQDWLMEEGPEGNCFEPKSMSVNGSIWILNKDNSIVRYYGGDYQETINLDVFPSPENITKIQTKPLLPYLYFLEPTNKRIIITDKTGKIIKQFQSEKFNNLKDFTISENGKTIWLLNDLRVYQIQL
jgi:hypothetical protein